MDVDLLYRPSSPSLTSSFQRPSSFIVWYFCLSFSTSSSTVCRSVKLWIGFYLVTHWPRGNINLRFLVESKKLSARTSQPAVTFHCTSWILEGVLSTDSMSFRDSRKINLARKYKQFVKQVFLAVTRNVWSEYKSSYRPDWVHPVPPSDCQPWRRHPAP